MNKKYFYCFLTSLLMGSCFSTSNVESKTPSSNFDQPMSIRIEKLNYCSYDSIRFEIENNYEDSIIYFKVSLESLSEKLGWWEADNDVFWNSIDGDIVKKIGRKSKQIYFYKPILEYPQTRVIDTK